jgi:hypothetical protein
LAGGRHDHPRVRVSTPAAGNCGTTPTGAGLGGPAPGASCRVIVDGYDDDPAPEDFHAAIREFLALDRSALVAATPSIFAYYSDVMADVECDWEPEHGLQIVFRGGRTVTKVGPYDGHLTNSAAYADGDLDGVLYRSWR